MLGRPWRRNDPTPHYLLAYCKSPRMARLAWVFLQDFKGRFSCDGKTQHSNNWVKSCHRHRPSSLLHLALAKKRHKIDFSPLYVNVTASDLQDERKIGDHLFISSGRYLAIVIMQSRGKSFMTEPPYSLMTGRRCERRKTCQKITDNCNRRIRTVLRSVVWFRMKPTAARLQLTNFFWKKEK